MNLIIFYRSTNPDHCLFIFSDASTFIPRQTPTIYRVLGFFHFVNLTWQNIGDHLSYVQFYSPLPHLFGGNRPFTQLNHFNTSIMSPVVANTITAYRNNVEEAIKLTAFYALKESINITLRNGCNVRTEYVFANLKFHQIAAIPVTDITGNCPPIACVTSGSLLPFMNRTIDHLLGIVKLYLGNATQYDEHITIAACETAAAFIINGSPRNLDYTI